jgi:PEP-CTERM motif
MRSYSSSLRNVLRTAGVLTLFGLSLPAATLDSLIASGGTITSGDKIFSNFSYQVTGSDMPTTANINVLPVIVAGNFGLTFQGLFHANPGNGVSTALIAYTVSVTGGAPIITDVHLDGDPQVNGGDGHASITGTVNETVNHTVVATPLLSIFENVTSGLQTFRYNDLRFTNGLFSSLDIQNLISASANGVNTIAQITHFEQTFSQVPEPSTVGLILVGLGLLARRRTLNT